MGDEERKYTAQEWAAMQAEAAEKRAAYAQANEAEQLRQWREETARKVRQKGMAWWTAPATILAIFAGVAIMQPDLLPRDVRELLPWAKTTGANTPNRSPDISDFRHSIDMYVHAVGAYDAKIEEGPTGYFTIQLPRGSKSSCADVQRAVRDRMPDSARATCFADGTSVRLVH